MSHFSQTDSHGGAGLHYIPPSGNYTRVCIFMHGLGDSAHGFAPMFGEFLMYDNYLKQNTKIILPTAPSMPVTINEGMVMPSWFDLKNISHQIDEDAEEFERSSMRIRAIMEREYEKGILPENLHLGGFSQGAALTYSIGIQSPVKLGSMIVCSGWLPFHQKILDTATAASKQTPILHTHGEADPLVLPEWAQMSVDALRQRGYNIELVMVPHLPHSIKPAVIFKWIKTHFCSDNQNSASTTADGQQGIAQRFVM